LNTGKVYLVGAGPGDPGLLTLRGRDVLAAADLVLYDGLVNPLLLNLTNAECERTARTQLGSGRIVPQEEINARLISEARTGRQVVRLKGGDPFIFGRGSEEAAALQAAGIAYEVVPGITAATAAGEYSGFSFTHREIASAVAFVTGHEDPTRDKSRLDYAALAAFPGTLVFYMGLGRIATICEQLVRHGKPAETPAAVVCRASLPTQRVVSSTLANLAADVRQARLHPPSLIVVGDCVSLRQSESWFEQRLLFGVTIGITRPIDQCQPIADRITRLSGQPVIMPLIKIDAIDERRKLEFESTLSRLETFDWLVFTSVNGVSAFFDLLWHSGRDVRSLSNAKIAAIGTSTAMALQERSVRPDIVPDSFRAEALGHAMAPHVSGRNVLWLRASRGRDILTNALRNAGASVQEAVVYVNEDKERFDPSTIRMLESGELHWVGLSSPSIVRQFAKMLKLQGISPQHLQTKIASISPVTTAAAHDSGLSIAAEAKIYTWDGIVDAISEYHNRTIEN
jgi:uroporphyrinogen III methyltransferase/synthase